MDQFTNEAMTLAEAFRLRGRAAYVRPSQGIAQPVIVPGIATVHVDADGYTWGSNLEHNLQRPVGPADVVQVVLTRAGLK